MEALFYHYLFVNPNYFTQTAVLQISVPTTEYQSLLNDLLQDETKTSHIN